MKLEDLIRRPVWHTDAACRTPHARQLIAAGRANFFPERGESAGAAREICATCPVRTECLDDAGDWERSIRGGLTRAERRRARR